nr:portal protein [Brevundimonas diminuta]
MAAWNAKTINERAEAAFQARKAMQPYIERALQYAMPWRHPRAKSGAIFEGLFDSSGLTGAHKFPGRVQMDVTPPSQRWYQLEAGPLVGEEHRERVNRQLDLATTVSHRILDASGFHKASKESYADLGIGTGALLALEGDDNEIMRWHAVPPWQLGIEEGPSGRIDNVYWKRTYPAWQLSRLWKEARWPEAIARKVREESRDPVMILQASYYDVEIAAWRYAVVCCESAASGEIVAEFINRTNPWNVFRWWTTPDSPWGVGPLMLTLPDIMTANKAVEMILKAAAYALAPPLMVAHDGVVNPDTLRVAPHSLIRVARTGGPLGSSIQPLDMNGRVDLAQLALTDVRQSIAQHTLSRQLPPESASVRSPTEIVERMRDFAFDTGSAFGSLNYEFVPNVVARVLDIADRKKIPGMDFEALKIDQLVLQVKITGPLARSQSLADVESVARYLEILNAFLGREGMMAVANVEELHRLQSLLGAPNWINRPAADREKMLQALGEAAASGAPMPEGGPAGQPSLKLVA